MSKERILPAVLISFLITIISLLMLYILTNLDSQRSILAIIIYATGIATGTYLAMKFKVRTRKEQVS